MLYYILQVIGLAAAFIYAMHWTSRIRHTEKQIGQLRVDLHNVTATLHAYVKQTDAEYRKFNKDVAAIKAAKKSNDWLTFAWQPSPNVICSKCQQATVLWTEKTKDVVIYRCSTCGHTYPSGLNKYSSR